MSRSEEAAREIAAIKGALQSLGPDATPAPALIRTAHVFHAVPLAELRKLARLLSRDHTATAPDVVLTVAGGLWFSDSREAMIVATMLIEQRRDVRDLLDPETIERWADEFDGWELVDNPGMAAIGPWVLDDPETRFAALESFAANAHPWTRRLALVGTLDIAAGGSAPVWWPRVRALCERLAGDREASIPKAISWVLRTYAKHIPEDVRAFVADGTAPMPSLARRETAHFLEFGRKRGGTPVLRRATSLC